MGLWWIRLKSVKLSEKGSEKHVVQDGVKMAWGGGLSSLPLRLDFRLSSLIKLIARIR